MVTNDKCECCLREDTAHRYFRCRLTKELRPEWCRKLNVRAMPACLRNHCVVPVGYRGEVLKRFGAFARVYAAIDEAVQKRRHGDEEGEEEPEARHGTESYPFRSEVVGGHPTSM